jgi:hypothetical protein
MDGSERLRAKKSITTSSWVSTTATTTAAS